MSTLSDLLADFTNLPGEAVAHLQTLVSEWQLLADLAFSDLLLWVPTEVDGDGLICVAQARPNTGATAHLDDRVNDRRSLAEHPLLLRAAETGQIVVEDPPADIQGSWLRRAVVPVRHEGVIIAFIRRDTSSLIGREASQLETAYVDAGDDLFQMVCDGTFPTPAQPAEVITGPRAGDGLLRLDADGRVVYGSPNAVSAYHRLTFTGELIGADLAALTRPLIKDPFDAAELEARIRGAVDGTSQLRMEVEARGATVLFRCLTLIPHGRPHGALVLVRDVTEVRRRDRALISKDATIREIHHRVKNNLQTVAALLRLQSRRSQDPSVRQALSESVRRVASIALVHETLSTSPDDRVDLDQIVDRLVPMISDVSAAESSARVTRIGSFGVVNAELATPMVMVLAEVVQNALQHAFTAEGPAGQVTIAVFRSARSMDITVTDDGMGVPEDFDLQKAKGLGLQIVRTLVAAELRGTIELARRTDATGTRARISVPLRGQK
ncbi:sensor histidine kinase [Nakamurella leprariae]|uniref:Histidine kinase N-terminal domain-containing protein n=1 Tax=Nakamurella leprariae TaxID=2803911 RepID=A0A938YEM8_9ACTN|nr:PAS domain-containing sensor histidine kinase [Nakamurella leprariae]MBM9468193.1 histidine kinase N-terminal domain-containing protein [Nakamurella leprariae]